MTKKLACKLTRGDIIRHNRRLYRVGHVGLVVKYPRNGRITGEGPRSCYKATLWAQRTPGIRAVEVVYEQSDMVSMIQEASR